jgi:hypothetical protein
MRLPRLFYQKFANHRDKYGDAEYDVQVMLEAFLPTLDAYLTGDDIETKALKLDLLAEIESRARRREEKADKDGQRSFAFFERHIALGERQRIKRGSMNMEHCNRRGELIDDNHTAQNASWSIENAELRVYRRALRGHPPETIVKDVLNPDGTPKHRDAA